ncbi:MAG: hypothetical protein II850_11210 [Fibrobacter sp.]|nr:hypothetical protein [Fibrobacter sp.]
MADYANFLKEVVRNYACRKRIEDIESYLAKRLLQELHIKYLKPLITEVPAFRSLPHPFGGEMRNWSVNPAAEMLDVHDLAQSVLDNGKDSSLVQLTTYPGLGSRQYLDPFNYYYLKPMVKGHEYKHFLAHSLPYNLAYIYGQKVYNHARQSEQQLSKNDIAMKIKAWLDYKYDPDYSRFDFMKDRVEDFDEYLDDMENEENIYYGCPSIEEELFDDYKMFIDEMDLE